MKKLMLAGAALAVLAAPAMAQTKVTIGISGWTGFAPLTLAKEAGIFAKNGLDVTIKKIPQASRHLALLSGDIQCAATTVETGGCAGISRRVFWIASTRRPHRAAQTTGAWRAAPGVCQPRTSAGR